MVRRVAVSRFPSNPSIRAACTVFYLQAVCTVEKAKILQLCVSLTELGGGLRWKNTEVREMKDRLPLQRVQMMLKMAPPARDFIGALRAAHQRTGRPGLIAEVKKASPSRGILQANFDPVQVGHCSRALSPCSAPKDHHPQHCHGLLCADVHSTRGSLLSMQGSLRSLLDFSACNAQIARAYEEGGAACLSVLTDNKYFKGSYDNIALIRKANNSLPIIAKEFVIEAYQLFRARAAGADAVLLIAAVLPNTDLAYLLKAAAKASAAVSQSTLECMLDQAYCLSVQHAMILCDIRSLSSLVDQLMFRCKASSNMQLAATLAIADLLEGCCGCRWACSAWWRCTALQSWSASSAWT